MTSDDRTFAVASDEALVGLILRARSRLVVIAPALTQAVANALSRRFDDLGQLDVTVVLDSDPEVYRLGFGDQAALETIRAASAKDLFDLREQAGVRIGVVISDNTTMVYSPVSKNIEAGARRSPMPLCCRAVLSTALPRPRVQTRAKTCEPPKWGAKSLGPPKCRRCRQT
jgi:hypothetical protein